MSEIICDKCGGNTSKYAPHCVHCGEVYKDNPSPAIVAPLESIQPTIPEYTKRSSKPALLNIPPIKENDAKQVENHPNVVLTYVSVALMLGGVCGVVLLFWIFQS